MGWLWKTASAQERGNWVRCHRMLPRASLQELFELTAEGVDSILEGADWKPPYSLEDTVSRIAEAAYGDRLYPGSPGFKTGSTSQEAARAVAPGTGEVRERVFEAIAASAGGLTADEAAAIVGRKPAYVRPRVSELAKAGRIAGVGRRRNPDTGLSAKVWQVKEVSNGAGR